MSRCSNVSNAEQVAQLLRRPGAGQPQFRRIGSGNCRGRQHQSHTINYNNDPMMQTVADAPVAVPTPMPQPAPEEAQPTAEPATATEGQQHSPYLIFF
jgi:hypothetical protein